jgi:hypothetical protein
MRNARLLSLALLAVTSAPAAATDLPKIDRTIAKEPVYEGKPTYCLLVFGPKAKTRVWLVKDDNHLYIDRNGNGYLTDPGERAATDIPGPDGKPGYTVRLRKYPKGMTLSLLQGGKLRYVVGDPDTDPLVFADKPSEAPVAHIGGPLAISLNHYGSLYLQVLVGTPGLGKGTFASVVLEEDVRPVAKVEFPSRERGGAPVVVKETLKDR